MDDVIGLIIQPSSVFDKSIKRIGTRNKTECSDDFFIFIFTYIAMSVGDFFGNQFTLWVAVDPLVTVSYRCHKVAGIIEYLHQAV